jgi:hypothetical protein
MRTIAAGVLALVASVGCYASGYGYSSVGYSTGAVYAGTEAGTYVAYSTPPPEVVDVDVYYEPRPGYTYVNGRYAWVGNQWVWQNGYWIADRPGHVYVQGYWRGNRWYDGRWVRQRPGYVYTGGYWDRRGRGHVWVPGTWERSRNDQVYVRGRWSNQNGTRVYQRGRWERSHRSQPAVRDHRRRR